MHAEPLFIANFAHCIHIPLHVYYKWCNTHIQISVYMWQSQVYRNKHYSYHSLTTILSSRLHIVVTQSVSLPESSNVIFSNSYLYLLEVHQLLVYTVKVYANWVKLIKNGIMFIFYPWLPPHVYNPPSRSPGYAPATANMEQTRALPLVKSYYYITIGIPILIEDPGNDCMWTHPVWNSYIIIIPITWWYVLLRFLLGMWI